MRPARWLAALAVAMALAASPGFATVRFKRTGAGTLGGEDALAGVKGACEADPGRIWVSVDERGECIAYFATGAIERQRRAVLYFEGDIPASYRHDRERLKRHLENLMRALGRLSRTYGVPYVLVARPGTFGSTGDHAERRKEREYLVMRAAIDALRSRHGLEEVSLAGQSGGATIVGAVLALGLEHVACAVPASGGFDLNRMLDFHANRLGIAGRHREFPASLAGSFNVMDHVRDVRIEPRRRVFVIGDEGDQVTPFVQQKAFAEALVARGHHARLLIAKASGSEHHGLTAAALGAAGQCANGASDEAIRVGIAK